VFLHFRAIQQPFSRILHQQQLYEVDIGIQLETVYSLEKAWKMKDELASSGGGKQLSTRGVCRFTFLSM
jgi:hypothetical protein